MTDSNPQARRLLIVANRSPFTATEENGELQFQASSGGLVTGLTAYLDSLPTSPSGEPNYMRIGWPGGTISDKNKDKLREIAINEHNSYPVFLSEEDMEKFYEGFCNKTIWPLFHYFPSFANYNEEYWEVYKKVNEVYCEAVMEVMQPDDIIWVHDYHLMLLPRLLRERAPDANIGFFLHIPFPGFELFRVLPRHWARGIVEGMLGADLIGFHTHDYTQYFLRAVLRLLGHEQNMGRVTVSDRLVKADTFPMGIDFDRFRESARSHEVQEEMHTLACSLVGQRVILSIDRLDYSKGITHRLLGFETFLRNCPDWHKKVVLTLVVIPSRVGVSQYQETKEEIEELVGRINGAFGRIDWVPIRYQYRSMPFKSLVAIYSLSDVALITPLRDGMNLIAKEYIASRPDSGTGVLILSEMAGAAKELGEALLINPNSRGEIAGALQAALEMPAEEQARRNAIMQDRLRRYNIVSWASDFIRELGETKEAQERFKARMLGESVEEEILTRYARAHRRLIFLDYDGTLMPFAPDPQSVVPTARVLGLLRGLSADLKNDVVLVSGRDKETLEEWFGHLPIGLIAEHGAWILPCGGKRRWYTQHPLTNDWKPSILPLLETYVDRLPGSFIEEKEFSLAWHYRTADPEMAPTRAQELLDHLVALTANINIQALQGHKVVEIKSAGVNKGAAAARWMGQDNFDFIMAMGDDWTDETLFKAMPPNAYSIRVGVTQSHARYNLRDHVQVLALLDRLLDAGSERFEVGAAPAGART